MYLISAFADEGRDNGSKYRRLFFFFRLVGALGLWRTYVIDNDRDRSKSGDGLLSINDRNAERQGRIDSSVSSPLFIVSSNFLLTPSTVRWMIPIQGGTERRNLRIRPSRLALKRRKLLSEEKVRNCE